MIEITPWRWAGFIICILLFNALDLGLFSARPRRTGFKQALGWSGFWVALAVLFALGLAGWQGRTAAVQFTTGYLIEWSLSLDNLLVITLIFSAFRMSPELQHHALAWGILGALAMRGLLIGVGSILIHRFDVILYLFGVFLLAAGVRTAFSRRAGLDLEKEPLVRLARRCFPIAADFDERRFLTFVNGRRALTPLALAVLLVESADVLFAFDSVPAIFSVTRDAFIVFTSNVFAILGLRSLYFVLSGALDYFRYLRFGLAVVLVFIGARMLVEPHGEPKLWCQFQISNEESLLVILSILAVTMAVSMLAAWRERRLPR